MEERIIKEIADALRQGCNDGHRMAIYYSIKSGKIWIENTSKSDDWIYMDDPDTRLIHMSSTPLALDDIKSIIDKKIQLIKSEITWLAHAHDPSDDIDDILSAYDDIINQYDQNKK